MFLVFKTNLYRQNFHSEIIAVYLVLISRMQSLKKNMAHLKLLSSDVWNVHYPEHFWTMSS